jgi:predicted ATP-grasp superfamily ATP-dependent carboligase
MRVFIYEETCATARLGSSVPKSLQSEGWAMLSAALEDFARLPGVETLSLLGDHLPSLVASLPFLRIRSAPTNPKDFQTAFRDLASNADGTLVIAPEFNHLLHQRCRWVEEAGGRLLGPSSEAVRVTGDKLETARRLRAASIPTPPCVRIGEHYDRGWPAVLKPRHGAGSQATFLVQAPAALPGLQSQAEAAGVSGDFLLQPFVTGLACSVAFLLGPAGDLSLVPCRQDLSDDGRFHYLGGALPLPSSLAERAVRLGRRAVNTIPGLRGFVGVDLVLGEKEDGSEDWVIEINPRLTTSYIGLRALCRDNLAGAMLAVLEGGPLPLLNWRPDRIRFTVGACERET